MVADCHNHEGAADIKSLGEAISLLKVLSYQLIGIGEPSQTSCLISMVHKPSFPAILLPIRLHVA